MPSGNQKAGPAFPFSSSIKGVLGAKTRTESIKTSMALILTTPVGTVVYNPELGSHVPYLVFERLDDTTLNLINYYAVHDLERQEPRIRVTAISVRHVAKGKVQVWVGFVDRDDETQKQQQAPISFVRT